MSATSALIIEIDEEPIESGGDRRRAMAFAFMLCVAVGSTFVGNDSRVPTASREADATFIYDRTGMLTGWMTFTPADARDTVVMATPAQILSLPPNVNDIALIVFPDRLANEALPQMKFYPIQVRAVTGLAVDPARPGDQWMLTWTEGGTAYWLVSDRRNIADLVRLADSMR
jgi:hypothetical protein